MRLRIVLLRSDGFNHLFLENLLAEHFDLVGVVVEPEHNQVRRLRQQRKWKAWWWRCYHKLRRKIVGTAAYRKRFFEDALPQNRKPVTRFEVAWINDQKTIDILTEMRPDIVITIGTSILGKRVLASHATFVNIHGGWLPDYRGNHCYFFAKYFHDFEKIGTTIHFVNAGVDTGNIIDRVRPDADMVKSNAEELYCNGGKAAYYRLVELLQQYEKGIPLPSSEQRRDEGKVFRTADRKFRHEIVSAWRKICSVFCEPCELTDEWHHELPPTWQSLLIRW